MLEVEVGCFFEAADSNSVTIFADIGASQKLRVWRDDKSNGPG